MMYQVFMPNSFFLVQQDQEEQAINDKCLSHLFGELPKGVQWGEGKLILLWNHSSNRQRGIKISLNTLKFCTFLCDTY